MNVRAMIAALCVLFGVVSGVWAFTPAEVAKNISWVAQSCVRIQIGTKVIYTDPLKIQKGEDAFLVLITHSHDDHFSPSNIAKLTGKKTVVAPFAIDGAILLESGQSRTFDGIKVTAVPAYNIKKPHHPKAGKNVGYLIEADGVTIYIAGDTERIPEMKTFTADIAIVPLGQTYTMSSVQDAVDSVLDVKASIAFPYHYGMYEGTAADADSFVSLLGKKGVKAGLLGKR